MYKLKKEYKGQNVIVYSAQYPPIHLTEITSQEDLERAHNIKGNEKFISKGEDNDDVVIVTIESIKEALERNIHADLASIVKSLDLYDGKGRVSRENAIILLNSYIANAE
jgi:hypothetical protein